MKSISSAIDEDTFSNCWTIPLYWKRYFNPEIHDAKITFTTYCKTETNKESIIPGGGRYSCQTGNAASCKCKTKEVIFLHKKHDLFLDSLNFIFWKEPYQSRRKTYKYCSKRCYNISLRYSSSPAVLHLSLTMPSCRLSAWKRNAVRSILSGPSLPYRVSADTSETENLPSLQETRSPAAST